MTTGEMEKRITDLETELDETKAKLNASEIQKAEYKAENERLMEIIRNFQRRHF